MFPTAMPRAPAGAAGPEAAGDPARSWRQDGVKVDVNVHVTVAVKVVVEANVVGVAVKVASGFQDRTSG
ncbi:MAG: hypothetical protein KA297_29260 [Kofleriaceae bacterium]|nr:hypothetical protein [Kofleriaceae bacterium]MBP6840337.1 hypothetical protein [Kofleriaceae bacterium]